MYQSKITSSEITSMPSSDKVLLATWIDSIQRGTRQPFALVKILGRKTQARVRVMEAIDQAMFEFSEKLKHQPGSIPRLFESFVENIRATILDAVLDGSGVPLTDFHAVFGIVYDRQILIAGHGKLSATFMHQTAQKRYTIYNLDEHFSDGKTPTAWKDILQSVLDGELNPGDVFYLGSRVPVNTLSAGELQTILTTLPIAGALKRIQQHIGAQTAYGAVGFKIKPLLNKERKKVNPLTSMKHFSATKKETAQVLGDQVPDVQAAVKNISESLSKNLSSAGTRGFWSMSKKAALSVSNIIRAILLAIIPKRSSLPARSKLGANELGFFARVKLSVNRARLQLVNWIVRIQKSVTGFSNTQKAFAGIAIAGLAILFGFVVVNTNASKNEQELQAATIVLDRIAEKISAANETIDFNNPAQVKALLNEATALFVTIPANKKLNDRVDKLKTNIAEVTVKLRKSVSVEVTLISEMEAGFMIEQLEESFLIQTPQAQYILNGEELTKSADYELTPYSGTVNVADSLVLASDSLYRILDESISAVVSGVKPDHTFTNIQAYNETLYFLDPTNEQIVRMRAQGNQYEAGTNWIIDKESSIADAVDIAIDGNVWMLLKNGLLKFTSGREQTFELGVIEPTLKDPTALYTEADSELLYILDGSEGRVIELNKEGEIIAQYESEELLGASAFFIDGKRVLFTNQKGLNTFELL